MADHTALLAECEKAIQMVRSTVPMNSRSESVWESLHARVRNALGMPQLEDVVDDIEAERTQRDADEAQFYETAGLVT